MKWPEEWSSKLHAEALACDPWKNHQWINKMYLIIINNYHYYSICVNNAIITFTESY